MNDDDDTDNDNVVHLIVANESDTEEPSLAEKTRASVVDVLTCSSW